MNSAFPTMHSSVFREAAIAIRKAAATTRAHGALRYQCPVTDSFVLVTDEAVLAALSSPHGRMRCTACGEVHLLIQNGEAGLAAQEEAGPPAQEPAA
jgi:hypothetical protein